MQTIHSRQTSSGRLGCVQAKPLRPFRCSLRQHQLPVAPATSSDDVCSVSDPNCDLPDPEVKLRRYGQFFGLNYQLPGWLRDVPRVRVRKAEEVLSLRQQEELLELTVLNEKLAGNDSWEIRKELEYLRQDRETWERVFEYVTKQDAVATLDLIEEACKKVEQELSDESREKQSVTQLQNQLKQLQDEVNEAQQRLSVTQSRVDQNMRRVNELKAQAVALERVRNTAAVAVAEGGSAVDIPLPPAARRKDKNLRSSLEAEDALRNFWYPAEFSSKLTKDLMVPLTLFNEPWVMFRDERGIAACIKDECAHRACPLSLGSVEDGKVVCPYHGWEYNGDGACTKMPSTVQCKGVGVTALPTVEKDGFIWIWPGDGTPPDLPDTLGVPEGFKVHAEIMLEVPVEHGLLVENLLDLAHAPFTHTNTFAKGWPVPDAVRFHADQLLFGHWDPYPIDMGFQPPCMTISMIGLAQPGKIMRGVTADQCKNHLHQLHVCMPSRKGHTRLLYRMCMDFMPWISYVPFIDKVWKNVAGQVLGEDLKLVLGQQQRLEAGSDTWANPVAYDKLAVRYRRWRNQAAAGALPAGSANNLVTMSAGAMFAMDDGYTDDDPEGEARLQQQAEAVQPSVDPSLN